MKNEKFKTCLFYLLKDHIKSYLMNDFFSDKPSSVVYFEYGTFHQFSMPLELFEGAHDC